MEFKLDMHTHTIASGHAYATVLEMIRAAADRGLELLGITEHAQGLPGTCGNMYFQNMRVIPRKMYGMEIMMGAEINILDYNGTLSLEEEFIDKNLDIRIAGIHDLCYDIGTVSQNTQAIVRAIENPQVDIISHPDDSRIPIDYETIVDAAKENHTLLEVNNSSLDCLSSRVGAWDNLQVMLKICEDKKVPVIADTDSHFADAVGVFDHVSVLLKEIDFPEELVVNRSVDFLKAEIRKHREILTIGKQVYQTED
ncbi:MAG TPA: phosphatase [Candidatus Anaerostipes avistercoris]|uniref:Phosphatase n=1 Tax=Candidatus Anaerostipes avistercoris TaxID=2838462 RepID=A0A9D2T799_9FIRM|nr:phosphatase [uncultured Anaerostipes sp.]HJC49137.1 phosphatase [Candidatus Anaerostipes avistercoris]